MVGGDSERFYLDKAHGRHPATDAGWKAVEAVNRDLLERSNRIKPKPTYK